MWGMAKTPPGMGTLMLIYFLPSFSYRRQAPQDLFLSSNPESPENFRRTLSSSPIPLDRPPGQRDIHTAESMLRLRTVVQQASHEQIHGHLHNLITESNSAVGTFLLAHG